ncbi:MAG: hypothetical protein COB02_00085 [Candidatus Cloacimonadota bacterium]|nr:MAG: hypothetical protein COB02_04220 [Candidatus Cloacimonadota bacterium]PCJ21021.1 MAG: hypothetical protein COB02_00085 [Candidatus Cloacimonadota bacterium]
MKNDYKILQASLSLRKFLNMSSNLQKLHVKDILKSLNESQLVIKKVGADTSYGKILLSHLKDSYKRLNKLNIEFKNLNREEKIENVSQKLGLSKKQISILLQLRVQDLNSQSQYIQSMSEHQENLLLLKHFFQQTPYPKMKLACLEKIKFWDSDLYQNLYEKLVNSCEPEIQAYLRLAS